MNTKLTLDDIADARAYERERPEFRERVIALRKRRRVLVGPIMSFVFENRDTVRFQIQEMARVEKLFSDEAIAEELSIYNPLIPERGQLSATMFIELTSDDEQREWKPKLIGVLDAISLRVGRGADAVTVPATIEEAHAEQLTREIPPSVNFLRWDLDDETIARVESGPVALVVDHENYRHETELPAETVEEMLTDLRG